jgi:hypothetical protein
MTEDIIKRMNLETEARALKEQGHSIRSIAKTLSEQTGVKVSASAVFRYLKESDEPTFKNNKEISTVDIIIKKLQDGKTAKIEDFTPQTPAAPLPDLEDPMKFLDEKFGHMLPPDKDSWSYRIGGMRTALLKRFMLPRDVIIKHVDEYCRLKGWRAPQPEPQRVMHVSFKALEERIRGRPWI